MKDSEITGGQFQFHRAVLDWYRSRGRDFPWRSTCDAFHILVAEVLLRQTQANRVVEPYLELIDKYPSVEALADAERIELSEWFNSLGLVRRADNLIKASRLIVEKHGGCVPRDLNALMSLPGVGTYTSRAVLSLAFRIPVPMVDESSGRLFRRFWGLPKKGPSYNDRTLLRFAEHLIPRNQSREFNLGVLDIAAAYCHVRNPICAGCPLENDCAYGTKDVPDESAA